MSKREERAIRFGITDGSGKRAATWKCWTPVGVGKSDVYLICRSLKGTLKASMHQSGEWHIAYSKEFFAENVDSLTDRPQGRFIDEWLRPEEIAPKVILAFRIITPHLAVNTPMASSNEKVAWIPAPPSGQATEICIFITLPDAFVSNWPGKNRMQTKLVDSMLLDSGEKIWVVYRVIDIPKFASVTGKPIFFKGRSRDDLKHKGLRIIAFASQEDGSRVILDSAVIFNENTAKHEKLD